MNHKESTENSDRMFLIFVLTILLFVCLGNCQFKVEIHSTPSDTAEITTYVFANR